MTVKEKIDRLRAELHQHNYNYYVLNAPEISDKEFDDLMRELQDLEKEHPEYQDDNSPTMRVGSDLNKNFTQVAHKYPMLSLGNTYSESEVTDFYERVKKALNEDFEICCELKYDGTSISLTYEDGKLVRAVTRGDGEKGDDVTDNVKTIRTIPLVLHGNYPKSFEIRGEILMPWVVFEELNREKEAREEPLFANPRNAAAGTLKLLSPAEVARRGLDAYLYYLLGDNLPSTTHYGNMEAARSWGFKVSDRMTLLRSQQEVDAFIARMDTERKSMPVATDGLVFKVNSLRQQLNLGFTAKSPRWAIAYKFAPERARTRLLSVSFDVGRMGTITPVANLEPVLLSGTVVRRASMHNEDIMRQLDVHEGDMLYVEKGGEIIPKIVDVDRSARMPGAQPVPFVSHCPACGSPLVRVEGEAAWVCPNKWGCPPQIVGRIEHFVGRRMMNIDGIGEETAAQFFAAGLIHDIADLYTLRPESIVRLEGYGPRGAERIMDGLRASLDVPFERVVFALSIPAVGETTARKVARTAGNIDRLMAMSEAELTAIEDVGPRIAANIVEYFAEPRNRDIVERLRAAGLTMAMPERTEAEAAGDALQGKTFVISGVFEHHSRDEYKAMIESNGGRNAGSISKKTDFVLAGANMGPSKLEKAQKLGVPIIDENEFLSMIGQ